jgi:hypothetical protein
VPSAGASCCRPVTIRPFRKIAAAENIYPFYVSRVLRMTLLAPDIVEAILGGRHSELLTTAKAMQPFPAEWARQTFT